MTIILITLGYRATTKVKGHKTTFHIAHAQQNSFIIKVRLEGNAMLTNVILNERL